MVPVCVWRPGRAASEPRRPLQKTPPIKGGVFFGVSKTPRRVCRPQAAKNQNHFSPRHVRGEKYLSDCKCGILPLAAKLCAQQAASLLSEKPGGFFDSLTTALGTVVFSFISRPVGYRRAGSAPRAPGGCGENRGRRRRIRSRCRYARP